jgi:hypothetical protein
MWCKDSKFISILLLAGKKNPLSAFVDNGKNDVDEIVTAIAVPRIEDNILIINSRDRN